MLAMIKELKMAYLWYQRLSLLKTTQVMHYKIQVSDENINIEEIILHIKRSVEVLEFHCTMKFSKYKANRVLNWHSLMSKQKYSLKSHDVAMFLCTK